MITKLPEPALEIVEQLSKDETMTKTQDEIKKSLSSSSQKSIRYAIRRLLENGIIYRVPNLMDMRSVSYRLAQPSELSIAHEKLSKEVFQDILDAMTFDGTLDSDYQTIADKN
ncbi:MAG: hypothetical protein IH840_00895 [Candidatus Heimdallarchaeota archaeon]|nr:hypothetical protein [Candidatus Heimdallarchaeota archaeon]